MSLFDDAFDYMIKNECNGDEVVENPHDNGGLTKYGISLRFMRTIEDLSKYGFRGAAFEAEDLIDLSKTQAKTIYKIEFWDNAHFEKIISQQKCNYIFDMAVNHGIATAIKIAQRACWSVMHKRDIIVEDGILNDDTISMINHCGSYLLPAMRSERAGYYRLIVERQVNQAGFLNGWLNRAYGG